MSFTLYRLELGDPGTWHEQLGDEITNTSGAPVPAIRSALRHEASLFTFGPEADGETTETRLRLRRQLRSLMNNTPFKVTGLFVHWPTDPEQDGWYMPDKGQLEDGDGSSGIATGYFKLAQFVWFKVGAPRTHRKAMCIYLKDLRTGLFARDYRRQIYSTDFSTLEALPLTYLPPGATDAASAASGEEAFLHTLAEGFDGGACQLVAGLVDNLRVSYEQTVANRNLGQVIAYDRRGTFTAPSKEVGAGWEEIYGPDYPYNWVEGGAIDTPVLTNGLCRVRYNREGSWPGWSVDIWNGTTWVEQGKIVISREGNQDTTLISAQLVEYSETRAVMMCVLSTGQTWAGSREVAYITLQRGWSGPRIEVYPALEYGTQVEARISFFLFGEDIHVGASKIDAGDSGAVISTAPGIKLWSALTGLGASTFTGENEVMVLRQGKEYALSAAVLQTAQEAFVRGTQTGAYGVARNEIVLTRSGGIGGGWCSANFSFYPLLTEQIMEAESMTLGAGTTVIEDAAASEKYATKAERTTDANAHITEAKWPNNHLARYRIFARVKTTASTLNIYAKNASQTGATRTTTSKTYVWVDVASLLADGTTLEIHCWASSAATVYVDRIEAFKLEDRPVANPEYNGGRDLGQSVLIDSRTIPTVVTRST